MNNDLVFIAYGQSGSGKTSTLVYFNNPDPQGTRMKMVLF